MVRPLLQLQRFVSERLFFVFRSEILDFKTIVKLFRNERLIKGGET